jgi:RNA polymerase sigma-70 factor (ECF subfamily)
MTKKEDILLIEQIIKNNDQKASNKLYDWYYKEVRTYVKKKFSKLSSEDVEDISSDTITKSFVSLTAFDSQKSTFKTWIYSIADNLVLDFNRKLENRIDKIHYHYVGDTDIQNFDIPNHDDYEETFLAKQAINYVVSKLDDQTHDMIKKKYMEGYSHDEIGEIYSLTSSTVSNKINYAKNKLTKTLLDDAKKKRGY